MELIEFLKNYKGSPKEEDPKEEESYGYHTINLFENYKKYHGIISGNRQSGRTTKLVDHAITLFFQGHKIYVKDHFGIAVKGETIADNILMEKIIRRLKSEHPASLFQRIEQIIWRV